jgi:FixJ family two-component response regulator
MLTRVLSSAGFEVAVFHSAEEFLAAYAMIDARCLVLDVDLPGMSGLDLQWRLKEAGQHVPILLVSGHATEQTRQQALSNGAIGLLSKPFDIEDLLSAIRSLEPVTLGSDKSG